MRCGEKYMKPIEPRPITENRITVPGSKSLTHRALLAAGLAHGVSIIDNALSCQDTNLTIQALDRLGVSITQTDENRLQVVGCDGRFRSCRETLDLGNSGTSIRLLTALVVLGEGIYRLTGNNRMKQRPIQELIDGLNQLGVPARSLAENGCPPVEIVAGSHLASRVRLDCRRSSQFLSGLLFMAPCIPAGLEIEVTHGPVSKPYVDLTLEVMEAFGVHSQRIGYDRFIVPGSQHYRSRRFWVEGDCSQAGYFWGAAAISGGTITATGIDPDTRQGDLRIVSLLEEMGCTVVREPDGICVIGGSLHAIEADMSDLPDAVPTIAVVAAYAKGRTVIKGVGHLKGKESDRIDTVVTGLRKMGIEATAHEDGLSIQGGIPHGAVIATQDDHRIAMSFAAAGLKTPGVYIDNDACVGKSFPDFWKIWEGLH